MRILILGSSGQIGGALVNYFKSLNHEVFEFDIENTPEQDLRLPHNPVLDALGGQVDAVVFLAFDVGGSKYLSKVQLEYSFIANNLSIMKNVFDFIEKYSLPVIFASSQMAGMLHSSYGNLKALGEKASISLNGKFIRFWNVYGHERDPLKSHVITDFSLQAVNLGRISMLTDGLEERDFLHVDDACRAIEFALHYPQSRGFDVASFKYTSILEIARVISDLTGAEIERGAAVDLVQSGHRFDPSDEILEFWNPKIDLQRGISAIVEGMRN